MPLCFLWFAEETVESEGDEANVVVEFIVDGVAAGFFDEGFLELGCREVYPFADGFAEAFLAVDFAIGVFDFVEAVGIKKNGVVEGEGVFGRGKFGIRRETKNGTMARLVGVKGLNLATVVLYPEGAGVTGGGAEDGVTGES